MKQLSTESEQLSDDTLDLDKTADDIRKNLDSSDTSAVVKAELHSRLEYFQQTAVKERKRLIG